MEESNSFKRSTDNVPYGYFSKYGDKSGIYEISCVRNNMKYIGGTNDISKRISKHFSELRFNRHTNVELQKDYNEFGLNGFEYKLLEETNNLLDREIVYQLKVKLDNLYNEKITGHYMSDKVRLQVSNTSKDSHKTPEYRDKMSKLKTKYKIAQYGRDKKLIKIFDSAVAINDEYPDYKINVIRGVCNGSKKSYKNFYWRYVRNGEIVLPK